MAKKKKKVKAGILKRKQEKKHKLQKQKKGQPVGNNLSMQKVQQAISKLALFVFEPEIQAITISKERVQAIYQKNEEMPLQIMEFVDEHVYQDFLQGIGKLLERIEGHKLNVLTLQSVLQFMQDDKYKQHMNQLVVAKYYCLLSEYQLLEQKITPENILQVVGAYEHEYGNKLSHYKTKTFVDFAQEEKKTKEQTPSKELPKKAQKQTPIQELHEKIKEQISTSATDEKLDLILEDIEMFFVDFLREKKIVDPEKITPALLKSFIRYVKQNLNPTSEDLENITISLDYLQKALHHCKII